jgi:hypothetical protein
MDIEIKYKNKTYKIVFDNKILETYKDYDILHFYLVDNKLIVYGEKRNNTIQET